jgi:hypothetical protein
MNLSRVIYYFEVNITLTIFGYYIDKCLKSGGGFGYTLQARKFSVKKRKI